MAYFLKITNNRKGTYLQIYESYYDPECKGGTHRSYKPIGYVHELQQGGIDDPIPFYSEEVQKLNQKYRENRQNEKRVVTFNSKLAEKQKYEMSKQLDARPVYLQKKDTIIGHFLICYLSVLLTRLV